MRKIKAVPLLGAVVIVTLLAACFGPTKENEVIIAQWGSEKYLIYLPLYIAEEAGFLKKRGVTIRIDYSGNDDQVFAKVLRGDAQFGVGDPIFTVVSRQQGADGLVVATIVDKVALWGIAKKGPPLTNPKDFSGKRIGTFPRPSTNYTLLSDTIRDEAVKNAQIVEIPIGNELALLESGAADVVMLLEPAASIAESKGYTIVTSFPRIWGKFAFTGLTTTESYANSNLETVAAMRDALNEAVQLAHNNRERAIDIASNLFPNLQREVIQAAVNRMLDDETLPKSIELDRESWIASVRVRQRVGDVNEGFDCLECLYSTDIH